DGIDDLRRESTPPELRRHVEDQSSTSRRGDRDAELIHITRYIERLAAQTVTDRDCRGQGLRQVVDSIQKKAVGTDIVTVPRILAHHPNAIRPVSGEREGSRHLL